MEPATKRWRVNWIPAGVYPRVFKSRAGMTNTPTGGRTMSRKQPLNELMVSRHRLFKLYSRIPKRLISYAFKRRNRLCQFFENSQR